MIDSFFEAKPVDNVTLSSWLPTRVLFAKLKSDNGSRDCAVMPVIFGSTVLVKAVLLKRNTAASTVGSLLTLSGIARIAVHKAQVLICIKNTLLWEFPER